MPGMIVVIITIISGADNVYNIFTNCITDMYISMYLCI